MEIDIQDLMGRFAAEIAQLTQRAVLAEARAASAEAKLKEVQSENINQ